MAKTILFEEFHVTVRVPRGLSGPECAAIRRSLNAAGFHAALRRAIREVFSEYPPLRRLRVVISR